MRAMIFIILLNFYAVSFAAEKTCIPTKKFTDFVRDQKVFTSNNPKKSITQYSTENSITPECVRDMLSAMTNQFAVEWVNKSKALGCYEAKPGKDCPEETKKEIFGNINLFEQWAQWFDSNNTPAPDFSLCAEQFSNDSFAKLTSSLSPIMSVLKKDERMQFVLDLQKLNCEEESSVSAIDSPNLEHFKNVLKKGSQASIEDFLKLWYPSKKGEREDDPYFFQCQENPWAALTKKNLAIGSKKAKFEAKLYSQEELNKLKTKRDELSLSYKAFMDTIPKMTEENKKELLLKLENMEKEETVFQKRMTQFFYNFYLPEGDPRWGELEKIMGEANQKPSLDSLRALDEFRKTLPKISEDQKEQLELERINRDKAQDKIGKIKYFINYQLDSKFYLPEGDPKWEEFEKKTAENNKAVLDVIGYEYEMASSHLKYQKTYDFLAEECKPDVLYSWGPLEKLKVMQEKMKDGEVWAKSPNPFKDNESTPLFMSMSPTSTFPYGSIGVRIKIKKSTPYRMISAHVGNEESEDNEVQVRTDNYQDFTTKDASIIESWSYGTPEQYDEMVRELKRFYDNKRAQKYANSVSLDPKNGLEKFYETVDGYLANEKILKQRLLNHIAMILKGSGKIYYQKETCRNREESFRTRKPTYFNPG